MIYSANSIPEWFVDSVKMEEDIVAFATSPDGYVLGLRRNGTVIIIEESEEDPVDIYYTYKKKDFSKWKYIVSIATGCGHTIGMKSDGTVVATGLNENGQCNVSEWRDIVAVCAGAFHSVGLKSDGTVVATGLNKDGQCNVSEWRDIVAIHTNDTRTIGVKADGTAVAVGDNVYGQCNVSEWKDVATPIIAKTKEEFKLKYNERRKKVKEAMIKKEQEQKKRLQEIHDFRKTKGVCCHCGGNFKGLFAKVCTQCGKRKDY